MGRLLLFACITCFIGIQTLVADVLVQLSLKRSAQEYVLKSHPDHYAKEARFNVPGRGFIRITYTDSQYNGDADSGGVSWRNVPGATTFAKEPGELITSVVDPDPPATGEQFQAINTRRVDGPMKNVGVVLTPRYRCTWSYGGYQYTSNLHVRVVWSPRQFEPEQGVKKTSGGQRLPGQPATKPQVSSKSQKIFNNGNGYGVGNTPRNPTVISFTKAYLIDSIVNYHYNGGKGDAPGTISLVSSNGKVYGPWPATTKPPDGSDPRKYWTVLPNVIIPAGTYTVVDSNPVTWAQNAQSNHEGMCWITARSVN